MSRFSAIDLSQLPAPQVVEVLEFEAILDALKAEFQRLHPAFGLAALESEPAVKLLQVAAYREMLLRARVNDAARAVMLASARGADLDQLAALWAVERQAGEADDRLRARVLLANEAFSIAGPAGAYLFHALKVVGVKDAAVYGPESGLVPPAEPLLVVLAAAGDGTAPPALLAAVRAACSGAEVRPIGDLLTVEGARVTATPVVAHLTLRRGPDPGLVLAEARARLARVAADRHRVGAALRRSELLAALHAPGVDQVALAQPATDLEPGPRGAVFVSAVTLTASVVDGSWESLA